MNLNWFLSRTLRHSVQMRKHVRKLISAQCDQLSPEDIQAVAQSAEQLRKSELDGADRQALEKGMIHLDKVATKRLIHYPHPGLRENIEVLLVAVAVAMGIRTFFLQPFKIPTGSMQPTLFGITHTNFVDQPDVKIPSRFNPLRFFDFWFNGVGYTHVVAKADGPVEIVDRTPTRLLLFNLKQSFNIGNKTHTVWFPPDDLWRRAGFEDRSGVPLTRYFKKGQDAIKLRVVSGDHLFVDRFTYNFRRPRRGEIVVFETKGIPIPQGQGDFYIKRLVALGSERVRLGNDRHLIIDGHRLDASTPHFELVYSFNGPPMENNYSGHVNGLVAQKNGSYKGIAPLFLDEAAEFRVRPHHYMVMGDNTLNSFDSRSWGDFPREKVIGKSFFVYWPIGTQPGRMGRFGWGHR
jgi:signal peptidase I